MIVNDTHIRCYDFFVLDIVTQQIVNRVKSFDTETNDAIIYVSKIVKGKEVSIKVNKEWITKKVNLPNCILLDTKTKEIVK